MPVPEQQTRLLQQAIGGDQNLLGQIVALPSMAWTWGFSKVQGGGNAAFAKAGTHRNGPLSAQEAATLPAIGNHFQELNADKNGMLSSEKFHQGAKP